MRFSRNACRKRPKRKFTFRINRIVRFAFREVRRGIGPVLRLVELVDVRSQENIVSRYMQCETIFSFSAKYFSKLFFHDSYIVLFYVFEQRFLGKISIQRIGSFYPKNELIYKENYKNILFFCLEKF